MRRSVILALFVLGAALAPVAGAASTATQAGDMWLWLPLAFARPLEPTPALTPSVTPSLTMTLSPSVTPSPTASPSATPTPPPVPSNTPTPRPAAELLSYSVFRPSAGSTSLYIAGEVRNNSAILLGYIKARFTLCDAAGAPLASDYALTSVSTLPPGLRSPFQVTLSDINQPYASVVPYLSWEPSDTAPSLLTVTESRAYHAGGIYHVAGWARNNTPGPRAYVEAVVTLYDNQGQVIGTGKGYAEPRNVEPGESTYFDVEVRYYAGKPAQCMARYEILVVDD